MNRNSRLTTFTLRVDWFSLRQNLNKQSTHSTINRKRLNLLSILWCWWDYVEENHACTVLFWDLGDGFALNSYKEGPSNTAWRNDFKIWSSYAVIFERNLCRTCVGNQVWWSVRVHGCWMLSEKQFTRRSLTIYSRQLHRWQAIISRAIPQVVSFPGGPDKLHKILIAGMNKSSFLSRSYRYKCSINGYNEDEYVKNCTHTLWQ